LLRAAERAMVLPFSKRLVPELVGDEGWRDGT
jgi:hypothetical protein